MQTWVGVSRFCCQSSVLDWRRQSRTDQTFKVPNTELSSRGTSSTGPFLEYFILRRVYLLFICRNTHVHRVEVLEVRPVVGINKNQGELFLCSVKKVNYGECLLKCQIKSSIISEVPTTTFRLVSQSSAGCVLWFFLHKIQNRVFPGLGFCSYSETGFITNLVPSDLNARVQTGFTDPDPPRPQ